MFISLRALPNPASIQLHLRFSFRSAGVLSEVGRNFGSWHSTEWFEQAVIVEA